MTDTVVVTGGAGYVGSHLVVRLAEAGFRPVIFDDFSNSDEDVVRRLAALAKCPVALERLTLLDADRLQESLARHQPRAVIHCAGWKSVADSVADPLSYHHNNVGGALQLLRAMQHVGCQRLIFSSSATVYGPPDSLPFLESHPLRPANPYGHGKRMIEQMMVDKCRADPDFRALSLRYFNPVGAHVSGEIGEHPRGTPNNLMPYLAQVAVGRRTHLQLFGADWPTADGSGVRDYIHVMDLAEAHLAGLRALDQVADLPPAVNIGTGVGVSVLEMVAAFEAASGRRIPIEVAPRRAGDLAAYFADPSLAREVLHWTAQRDLLTMCHDAWRWQSRYPDGFGPADGLPATRACG